MPSQPVVPPGGSALGSRDGVAWCRARSAEVDRWLAELLAEATSGDHEGLALAAVGGYGRGELAPASDIDVVLLHSPRRQGIPEVAERLWYPIWARGERLGHSVSTVKQALGLAAGDLETATSLLAARHVAGDPALTSALASGATSDWQHRARQWLPRLAGVVEERQRRFGEVAFRLEPDLKEGRGGLRDVHALEWLEAAHRVLLEIDGERLAGWSAVLTDVRVALQQVTASATNVLPLEEQDAVATALGDGGAGALMSRVAEAARSIAWTSDDAWRRVQASLRRGTPRRGPRPLEAGIALHEGPPPEVVLGPEADAGDLMVALRVAVAAATHGAAIERGSLERLAAGAGSLPEPWPATARQRFLQLLGAGPPAVGVIEALDQRGIWGRLLPEWAAIRALPPHGPYHRFTVDRHLLETVAQVARLAGAVERPDLLALAALLHDLGKGREGDHTATGAALTATIARRMGFEPGEVEMLSEAVRLHLLLADVATSRDLDDPGTVERVADAVGSPELLRLLAALTEADSLATGPSAWGHWKAGLVRSLVDRSDAYLRGEAAGGEGFPSPRQLERLAGGGQVIEAAGHVLTVMDDDRPGMFSRVAGVLAMHGLDVLAAAAYSSEDGRALSEFRVADPPHGDAGGSAGAEPGGGLGGGAQPGVGKGWGQVVADLRRALSGRLAVHARVMNRARTYARSRPVARGQLAPSVTVDNDASQEATVIDVHGPDGVGTLYRITRALADFDLDIRRARVRTLGSEVVDSFYVRDAGGRKVFDEALLGELERAILHNLAE